MQEEDIESVIQTFEAMNEFVDLGYVFVRGESRPAPSQSFKWFEGDKPFWGRLYVRRGDPIHIMQRGALYAVLLEDIHKCIKLSEDERLRFRYWTQAS